MAGRTGQTEAPTRKEPRDRRGAFPPHGRCQGFWQRGRRLPPGGLDLPPPPEDPHKVPAAASAQLPWKQLGRRAETAGGGAKQHLPYGPGWHSLLLLLALPCAARVSPSSFSPALDRERCPLASGPPLLALTGSPAASHCPRGPADPPTPPALSVISGQLGPQSRLPHPPTHGGGAPSTGPGGRLLLLALSRPLSLDVSSPVLRGLCQRPCRPAGCLLEHLSTGDGHAGWGNGGVPNTEVFIGICVQTHLVLQGGGGRGGGRGFSPPPIL